jgi:dipeptidase E
MRLFLSSYRAGNYPNELINLFGKGSKIAVISNAKDYKSVSERKVKMKEVLDFFLELDFKPKEIDLRPYFKDSKGLEKYIKGYKNFWLAGGNVFVLRRALRQSELEPLLGDWVRQNSVVLGGESAGALIMGPTLKGSEMEGDSDSPDFIPQQYDKKIIWDGLNYVNYLPVPHYKDEDYGPSIDKYIEYLKRHSIPYKLMTNDQAIIINGTKEEFLK